MEYANYIAHCIEIARRGEYFVAPNPMVGAVLVYNGEGREAKGERIIAEGWHERYGEGHAEVNCFRNAEEAISHQQSAIGIRTARSLYRWSHAVIMARRHPAPN